MGMGKCRGWNGDGGVCVCEREGEGEGGEGGREAKSLHGLAHILDLQVR